MKKNEVQIGATYLVSVTGKLAPVRIVCEHPHHGWNGVNVDTKREVRIKSAQRLRKRLDAAPRALPSERLGVPPTTPDVDAKVKAAEDAAAPKPSAPVAPEAAKTREPWQMTQAEYGSRVIAAGPDFAGKMGPHRGHVESAIAAGKPVPAAVLADYPDLAAKTEAPAKGAFAPEGGRGQDGVDIKAGQMFRSAAQVLGRLAAGKPKRYSQSERERRREALAEARKKRWPRK